MRLLPENLGRTSLALRAGALFTLAVGALLLRALPPASFGWLRPTCGAVTGLPCIFCGTTRALHHLLAGDFSRALYFNWLAFPVALAGLLLGFKLALELALRRQLSLGGNFRLTPRQLAGGLAGLVALWIFQVALALAGGKHELLNPAGPLYALFVR